MRSRPAAALRTIVRLAAAAAALVPTSLANEPLTTPIDETPGSIGL